MRHLLAVNTRTHSGEQHTEMGRFTEAFRFPAGAGFSLLNSGPIPASGGQTMRSLHACRIGCVASGGGGDYALAIGAR